LTDFYSVSTSKPQYERIEAEVASIPGVLATGLLVGRASLAVVADAEHGPLATPLQPTAPAAAAAGG
jgi:ribose 5-phosphate isomerase